MVTVASRYFDEVGFRGMFTVRGVMRFTLSRFDDQDEAELWALKLLIRWRSVYAIEG